MLLLPPPVLELRATELGEALPLIGARYGVRMTAAPAIEREILVARIDRANVEETKARIATEFAAEWRTTSDGTLVLRPDANARAAQERAWIAGRRATVRERQGAWRAMVDAMPPMTPETGVVVRAETKAREEADRAGRERRPLSVPATPMRRLALRLAGILPPETIETGVPESRDVLSTAPTDLQAPLPKAGQEAVRAYLAERARFEDPSVPSETPVVVTVAIFRYPTAIALRVRSFDARGRELDTSGQSFDLREGPARDLPGAPIPFRFTPTPEALAAERIFTASTRSPFGEVREILMREPLGFGASDVLLSAAREADRDLILAPGDEAFAFGLGGGAGDLRAWTRGAIGGRAALDGDLWLGVRTGDPWFARRMFVPRPTLRRLVAAYGGRKPTLAEQAALAPLLPARGFGATAETFVWTATGNGALTNLALVRAYGALSAAERAEARDGVALKALTRTASERLRELVFHIEADLGDRSNPNGPTGNRPVGATGDSAWDEPTTLFGTGPAGGGALWPEGELTLDEGRETVLLVPRNGEPQRYTIENVAELVLVPGTAVKFGFDLTKLGVSTRERAEFHLRWRSPRAGLWGVDLSLPGAQGEVDARTYDVTTLPDPIRRELEAAIARLKAEGDRTVPPPASVL